MSGWGLTVVRRVCGGDLACSWGSLGNRLERFCVSRLHGFEVLAVPVDGAGRKGDGGREGEG